MQGEESHLELVDSIPEKNLPHNHVRQGFLSIMPSRPADRVLSPPGVTPDASNKNRQNGTKALAELRTDNSSITRLLD